MSPRRTLSTRNRSRESKERRDTIKKPWAIVAPGAILAFVVLGGTLVPFALNLGALAHLPATQVGVVGMAEPVLAALVAWLWLGQSLSPVQLVGGAVVLGAVLWSGPVLDQFRNDPGNISLLVEHFGDPKAARHDA